MVPLPGSAENFAVGEPLLEGPALRTVGHEEVVHHVDGQRVAAVPAEPAGGQRAAGIPLHRVGLRPDDLAVAVGAPRGGHGAEVVDDLVERGALLRFQQLVLGHVDHRFGGIGGNLPQLLVVGLGNELRTVAVGPVAVDRVSVEERAGGHQQHARLDGAGGAHGRQTQIERLVARGRHAVLANPVDLAADPLHAVGEGRTRLRRGDLIGGAARRRDGNRAVGAQ